MSSTTVTLTPPDLLAAWRLQRRNNFSVKLSQWAPLFLAAVYFLSNWHDLLEYGWRVILWDPVLPLLIVFLATMNLLVDKVTLHAPCQAPTGTTKKYRR